jgi:hypothetical protein
VGEEDQVWKLIKRGMEEDRRGVQFTCRVWVAVGFLRAALAAAEMLAWLWYLQSTRHEINKL